METLENKIRVLKEKRRAVILAHNYQLPEVQEIADFNGDSLELSRRAADTDAETIVFCGVHFMAETAAILSPEKTVLLPEREAGCPMADMITADQLRELKGEHPGAVVVCYVNSSAEVKAESDYCCTSANAVAVVESIPEEKKVLFVPDKYLGQYTSMQTGRDLVLWPGFCPTHVRILDIDIERLRREHPGAVVMAHPECPESVRNLADAVLSTSGMCRYARESGASEFVVATEIGLLHRLKKENPGKRFYIAAEAGVCPNMKRITLESVLSSLEEMRYEIKVPEGIREKALRSIERMIAISPPKKR